MISRVIQTSVALVCLLLATGFAHAQTLTTTTPNNGDGGLFIDLVPGANSLALTNFASYFTSNAGTPVTVEVWTRPGSYVGFTGSSAGWTLTQTVTGTSAGQTTQSAPFAISPILLPAGTTTAVYLHSITVGGGMRYTGSGTTAVTTYSNSDLTLNSTISRIGNVSFGGTEFTPRCFAGTLGYSLLPRITTTTPNNGTGGVFLDLTASAASALNLNSFAGYFNSAAGTPVSVEVWTRPGTYVGFTASNAGWTLTQTVGGVSAGSAVLSAPIALTPILVPAGATTAVYFHSITVGGGMWYTGTGTTAVTMYSNANITLNSTIARTGNVSFGGTEFTPRCFAGTLEYSLIPTNNECASAAPLTVGVPVAGSNANATQSVSLTNNGGIPYCTQTTWATGGANSQHDVYWAFTVPATGIYTVNTCGSSFDTIISVHSGCPATQANLVSCNDDSGSGAGNTPCTNNLNSRIPQVALNQGTTYYVRVFGYNNATGSISLVVNPASGVCCRGATCNTAVPQFACNGAGAAGAAFFSGPAACNPGAVSSTPCCFADYNKVGGITVQDIFDFLADWFAGNLFANTGGPGNSGVLSVQNIFDFLTNWFSGC